MKDLKKNKIEDPQIEIRPLNNENWFIKYGEISFEIFSHFMTDMTLTINKPELFLEFIDKHLYPLIKKRGEKGIIASKKFKKIMEFELELFMGLLVKK